MTDILLVAGSLRRGSVNLAVLETAASVAPAGVDCRICPPSSILPHFNPDDDREPLDPAVNALRQAIGEAGAVLFCVPEYAGGLPGSFKNLLDWTVGGVEPDGKPVGWINASSPAAPKGGEDAHAALALTLGYVGARIVASACVRVPVPRHAIGADGTVGDPAVRYAIALALSALAGAAA